MVDATTKLDSDLARLLLGTTPRASDKIEEKLRWMIITQAVPAGSVVAESHLAKLFDCSHAPLREALNRLSEQGWVRILPRRGIIIAELNSTEVGHLWEVFSCVYELSARLAAERITNEQLATMRATLDDMQAVGFKDLASFLRGRSFHASVAKATGNQHLVHTLVHYQNLMNRYSYLFWKQSGSADFDESLGEYRALVSALESRDPDESQRCARQHLANAARRISKGLEGFYGPTYRALTDER